jgi:hypothetical protein
LARADQGDRTALESGIAKGPPAIKAVLLSVYLLMNHNQRDAEDCGATMVAGTPRLLCSSNTPATFAAEGVPLLRAPLFSHTPS